MVKTLEMMRTEIKRDLRGGSGEIPTLHLLEADETMGKCNLCSHMTLQPGVSIGEHPHNPDAEIYYCLKGELTVSDNGTEKVMHAATSCSLAAARPTGQKTCPLSRSKCWLLSSNKKWEKTH